MADRNQVAITDTPGRRWQKFFGWLISSRGLVYLATRYGSTRYRQLAFEGNYRRGRWNIANPQRYEGLSRLLQERFHLIEHGSFPGRRKDYLVLRQKDRP